jgi:hypothetical protein
MGAESHAAMRIGPLLIYIDMPIEVDNCGIRRFGLIDRLARVENCAAAYRECGKRVPGGEACCSGSVNLAGEQEIACAGQLEFE